VEGAVLLVDGTQGIQAQTLANLALAKTEGLTVIGAINKIDLPIPDLEALSRELAALIGTAPDKILRISAKTGDGVERLLEEVIRIVPPPAGDASAPCRALIFDSKYDSFRGAIAYVRVKEGTVRPGATLYLVSSGAQFEVMETGYFQPALAPCEALGAGEIGYVATGLKRADAVRVGDTIGGAGVQPLPGYREPQPLMFAGFYPPEESAFEALRDALAKLKLNDAALTFTEERQEAFGKGFRVGFLGALHMEIVRERMSREYGIEPLVTMPSVRYRVKRRDGTVQEIETPQELPPEPNIAEIREPWASGEILLPAEYLGPILELLRGIRGTSRAIESLERGRLMVAFEAPLAELVIGFHDRVKSVSRGYASIAYEVVDWRSGDLVKLDILIAGEPVSALARIVPRPEAPRIGRATVAKLKDLLPREVFAVPLQAAVAGKIIARETIPALRKDVTAHLYGGDRTRKMKLWKKQQEGKKRLARTGKVRVEPKVFFDLLKLEE
jgi:GTP-binding protein LepA